jgi:FAD/FMN-containing dehydrogenase
MDPAALASIVGAAHVHTDAETCAAAARDWTGRVVGTTPAVVRPGSTAEVSAVLARCHAERIPVVPQGGNTGLAAGATPSHGEVVLDLRRLDHVGRPDQRASQLTAGAGATIAAVQQRAAEHGLRYAVDLASRDQATVGGTVATNAGGVHVLRWGSTRQQLAGVEAVLADGRVVTRLAGLDKDNTGYDLTGLLCGSEGTLAVVTAARLRLVPDEPDAAVALIGVSSVAAAVDLVARARAALPRLSAAELMLAEGVDLVCAAFERRQPLPDRPPVMVLVEVRGTGAVDDELAAALAELPGVGASAMATDSGGRGALWSYREDHTLAINTLGPPHKLDVTLPLPSLAEFVDEVPAAVAAVVPDARVWLFGHVGDGNVHVNVTDVAPDDERIDDAVLELVSRHDGSISAEHGIGTLKRRWLHLSRSDVEIDVFRAIKSALDPHNILNPNALLP